jgi:hypothetical protein
MFLRQTAAEKTLNSRTHRMADWQFEKEQWAFSPSRIKKAPTKKLKRLQKTPKGPNEPPDQRPDIHETLRITENGPQHGRRVNSRPKSVIRG